MCDVDPSTGLVCFEEEDFSLNGENPFFFTRRYNNHSSYEGPFGLGWMHPYDVHLSLRNREIVMVDSEARAVTLRGLAAQGISSVPAESITARNVNGSYVVYEPDGRALTFAGNPRGDRFPLVHIDETDHNSIDLSYEDWRLVGLRTSSDHQLAFEYRDEQVTRIRIIANGRAVPLTEYEYDGNRQLIAAYNPAGVPARYSYSGRLMTQCTNRVGGSFYLQYDSQKRCSAVWQDGLNRLRRVEYDDRRRTRLLTDSTGRAVLLRYNENGLLSEAEIDNGVEVSYVYADGNEPIAVVGLGPQGQASFNAEDRVCKDVDADGRAAKIQYDEYYRPISEIDEYGGITSYKYDDHNRIIQQTESNGAVTALAFNENGNLIRQVQPLGNVVRGIRSNGLLSLEDSVGPLYSSEHDGFGNTIRMIAPSGRSTIIDYDECGHLVALKKDGALARHWYDANGYRVAEVDYLGNRTEYQRDQFGLMLAWVKPTGKRIQYHYDSERRLAGATSSDGLECRYDRDSRGRLTRLQLRDGRHERIEYDQDGRRSVLSNSGGRVTRYNYTPAGLLSDIRSEDRSIFYEYDKGGNHSKVLAGDHVTRLEWASGPLLKKEEQDGFQISYDYNEGGLTASRTDSTGRDTRYEYNRRGDLTVIVDSVFGVYRILRDANGSESGHQLPNGFTRDFVYDGNDEISNVVTKSTNGEVVSERRYAYAASGELMSATTAGAESVQFRYDSEYQLLAVQGSEKDTESFRYDQDENVVYSSRTGEYRYEAGRLVKAGNVSYAYDSSGRAISRESDGRVTTFSYGLGGLIKEAVLSDGARYTYEYDGFGRRVRKIGPNLKVTYCWDREVLLCERRETPDGQSLIQYLYLPGSFSCLGHAVNGVPFFYELDQRSLVREVYQGDHVAARYSYNAFGERRPSESGTSDSNCPFRLLGQLYDEETGLHYNRFRYFDAVSGRFLSPDLSIRHIEHNPYSYSPNPIKWADPLGLMARFSQADADTLKAQQAAENDGFFECSNCHFKNKNKVFAIAKASGRPVGDGSFHAGHIVPHAEDGSADIDTNATVEGGTCNCSKGKRDKSGMT